MSLRCAMGMAIFLLAACTGGSDPGTSTSSTTSSGATSSGSTSSTSGGSSGGSSSGSATCVTIDPASYSRSCLGDSDCMIVPTGTLCTGQCGCGGTALAKSESAKYRDDTSSVKLEACPCASPGIARCVGNSCTLCGFANPAPGCPDGG